MTNPAISHPYTVIKPGVKKKIVHVTSGKLILSKTRRNASDARLDRNRMTNTPICSVCRTLARTTVRSCPMAPLETFAYAIALDTSGVAASTMSSLPRVSLELSHNVNNTKSSGQNGNNSRTLAYKNGKCNVNISGAHDAQNRSHFVTSATVSLSTAYIVRAMGTSNATLASTSLCRTKRRINAGIALNTPKPITKNNTCGKALAATRLLLRMLPINDAYRRLTARPTLATFRYTRAYGSIAAFTRRCARSFIRMMKNFSLFL
mmetsp:Transcript_194/g.500  ORF Transcript_194/g.500 Transcript_194/m.500 type:complete len:263 (+) Transcript_194:167-955(+)